MRYLEGLIVVWLVLMVIVCCLPYFIQVVEMGKYIQNAQIQF